MFSPPRSCLLLTLAGLGLPALLQAGQIDAIYAFGDSLSDVGNVYLGTGGLIPRTPYVNGQFTNGSVWVQDLAGDLGLPPLLPSLGGGTDYAYGSGQSGTTLFNTASQVDLLGATGQLSQYEATHAAADPNALYTIWVGSNDLAAIPATATPTQIATDLGLIAGNIDTAIGTLAALGAKNFLIVTVPDLGKTPDSVAAGIPAATAASQLSFGFDSTLVNGSAPIPSLSTLAAADAVTISVLNTYALIDTIVGNPGGYGFTNATSPCLTGSVNYSGGTVCATPNQYVFWDGEHPTAAADVLTANAALAVLAPEPASVSLLAAGLLGLLLAHRRRRAL